MPKAIKLDLSKIAVNTVDSDRRVITSESVQRPVRDILATVNTYARQVAWNALVSNVIGMRGETVEAKGASWAVNDDEIARSRHGAKQSGLGSLQHRRGCARRCQPAGHWQ